MSDAEVHVTRNVDLLHASDSLLPTDPRGDGLWGDRLFETQSTIRVPTITLDDYCRSQGIDLLNVYSFVRRGIRLIQVVAIIIRDNGDSAR